MSHYTKINFMNSKKLTAGGGGIYHTYIWTGQKKQQKFIAAENGALFVCAQVNLLWIVCENLRTLILSW